MPDSYTLTELCDLAGVTPRTVRYYISQGLLPSPSVAGPQARYTGAHLERLRLVRQLQVQHQPLAEIRQRLAALSDADVSLLVNAEPAPRRVAESAVEYVRGVLANTLYAAAVPRPAPVPPPAPALHHALAAAPVAPADPSAPATAAAVPAQAPVLAPMTASTAPDASTADRSQWDRIALAPDIELHIRRPLSRIQNRRVDRLLAIARQLLQEDQS